MTHNYEFLDENSRVCCSTDDIAELCRDCKVRYADRCAILAETPHQASRRLTRENAERFAAAGLRMAENEAPNPYAAATTTRANERHAALTPENWPGYHPKGAPPDGYAMHLAMRVLDREDAEEAKR